MGLPGKIPSAPSESEEHFDQVNKFTMHYAAAIRGRNLELSRMLLDLVCLPPAVASDNSWLDTIAEERVEVSSSDGAEG